MDRTVLLIDAGNLHDAVRDNQLWPDQQALRDRPYTERRPGRVVQGRQEGVDARIHRDLTALARQGSAVSAFLLAGGEDLCEAVAEAQSSGVQVVLLVVQPAGDSRIADALTWAADDVVDLDADFLAPCFSLCPTRGGAGVRRTGRRAARVPMPAGHGPVGEWTS